MPPLLVSEMKSILPTSPEDSRLAEWVEEGHRHEPHGSNIVTVTSPDKRYALTIELDEPVHGHLIRLWKMGEKGREDRIAQTIIENRDDVGTVAAEMVAAADDLAALDDDPSLGPDTIYEEDVERGTVEAPDEWDDEDEWREALEDAYEEADIQPGDLDFAEVHDCFAIAELAAYEDLGFCDRGEAAQLLRDGTTDPDGKIPVNTSGGLKSKGHPIGATGTGQAVEAFAQLRGEAHVQVDGASVGLTHNVGGSGGGATVHVFEQADGGAR